jgi:hypothetical protein
MNVFGQREFWQIYLEIGAIGKILRDMIWHDWHGMVIG